ncbi:Putative SH3 domain, actin-depolymerizing factor domain, ADF-H/Gelsolin-like domain superfamily [Septoria linicola]|uniref:SH3 domain, actin-depolymerizing factor domain, ADF-H/Gelsolin-like domain superfamily n=1 Tax=Septoria linicola TaxID=215465 RepID=A0A9Q9EEX0_9PEZI|nr:putative SH3 domain, actin-depolymerizing factor domain, ADF-H/Gelsolin-like domain superfamily [Septoria linicola]USW46982.1 Putative SH3 domain, actin-depolymerizing factor domain, ADF-H/Gelsolin-like domain superfamily [Septoria linicola]
MAALNLSQNGPSITASYQKIVNSAPNGPAASSPTYGIWAVFSVKAPLANAFQADSSKESVLSVQTTGEGELADLIEDFSDGRIQFAFVKVKDPNTTLPKSVLIAWCGEGVPERTKGYFTSHLNAVSKVLHGYHVQVTARSDRDLTPESIVQKVADSSGSKYSGGGSIPSSAGGPPPPKASKPVLPTKSFGPTPGFSPLGRTRAAAPASSATDSDGWGTDAPPVTRSQLEKVSSAYQPTKVNMADLQTQREPSKFNAPAPSNGNNADVVSGGYQPIGKVDIAAIRRQAQASGSVQDDRPTVVKGAYEPIGKVDLNEIRRKAQAAPPPAAVPAPVQREDEDENTPRSLADRSAAFQQNRPLTELPKPKVANRFGAQASNFSGTKAPTPAAFQSKPIQAAAPVGAAGKNFADEGGKTPAQIWAERKARERGLSGAADTQQPGASSPEAPMQSQPSGGWQSSYGGKKWGVQIPTRTGGSGISEQRTGQAADEQQAEEASPPTGGVGSIRDRFAGAAPMGAVRQHTGGAPEPPPLDTSSKPNAGARGVPIPGLSQTSSDAQVPTVQHQDLPPPPPRGVPQDEEDDDGDDAAAAPQGSPVRIAMPVGRGADPIEPAEALSPQSMPEASLVKVVSQHQDLEPEPQVADHDPSRGAAQEAAVATFGHAEDPRGAGVAGGMEAIAQYDYEKDEENEIALQDGERITNIEMVDDDWWMGENSKGEKGLFPSNYVELVEGEAGGAVAQEAAVPTSQLAQEPPPGPPQPQGGSLPTATAEYDYEAAEENELSFPDGAKITNVEFPDENWWSGEYNGKAGLFPANYVQLDQ